LTIAVPVITHGRTPVQDRFIKDFNDKAMHGLDLLLTDLPCLAPGTEPASKKDLTGINVPDACHKGVVKQDVFNGTDGFLESLAHHGRGKVF
jgi:hypothetical protein